MDRLRRMRELVRERHGRVKTLQSDREWLLRLLALAVKVSSGKARNNRPATTGTKAASRSSAANG